MWWKKKPRVDERPLHEQLVEARDALLRQIEIMEGGSTPVPYPGGSVSYDGDVAMLRETLRQIEGQLAETPNA